MSRLEDLIAKLCPDGVEYKVFSEICQYIRGVTYNKSQEAKNAEINSQKILRANNITLSSNTLNFDDVKLVSSSVKIKKTQYLYQGDILICAGSGSREHIGKVAYIFENLDYSFGGFMAVIRCSTILDSRFLFHILTSNYFKNYLDCALNSSTINNLSYGIIKNFLIPVPPIEVQREIVRILDSFTELTSELTSELTARKQQYEYYQHTLLDFDSLAVEYRPIKELYKRIKGTPITAGKMKEIEDPDGEIKIFAGGKTVINAKEKDIPNANITRVPAVLVQSRGIIDVVYYDKPFTFKSEMWAYTSDSVVSIKFLYYVLKNNISKFRETASGMGSMPQISLSVTEDFKIPVPPLETQQRIVSILDRFDALCNDLTSGIPAEIDARQKQYEYYRDKLLTFKRKQAGA